MSKVNINVSSPESWLPRLERKTVAYDPIHGELVGGDCAVRGIELVGAEYEIDGNDSAIQDDTGAYLNAELIGEELGEYGSAYKEIDGDADMILEQELNEDERNHIGDDENEETEEGIEDEEYEESHEEGEEEENEGEYGPVDESHPDFEAIDEDAPEPIPPASTAAPIGTPATPLRAISRAMPFKKVVSKKSFFTPKPKPKAKIAANAVLQFRNRIKRKDPVAIKALFKLQSQAKTSPKHAAVLNAVVHAKVSGHVGFHFGGDVAIVGKTVVDTAGKIIKLALSPVVWATHGAGTVTKEVGSQLQNLSRKI